MKYFKTWFPLAGLLILLMFAGRKVYSQEYRTGGSVIYNFRAKGIGLEARVEFPIKRVKLLEGLSIVPQFSYYPPFNDMTEFYLGSSVHLGLYKINKWIFYGLANASYNGWINYDESPDADAHFSNLALEGGLGVTRKKCVRPFLELRLNAIGMEPSVRLGFLYTFNCERRGAVPCSKIPPQPQF
jgi:hypothetical protein